MSVNSINGVSSYQYGIGPSDPIKPETRRKLKELGIDENSVKTETQAQHKIKERLEQMKKRVQERMQEQASTQIQTAQAQVQPQQVQGVEKNNKVEGLNQSQQIQEPKGVEQQYALHNQQQGDEQVRAFAGSQSAQAPKEAQKIPAFQSEQEIIAMYKKLQLGLL